MQNRLAAHTNCFHTYSFDEALDGVSAAGFRYVELSAVPGWTEHVSLDATPADVRAQLDGYGLEAISLSAHSDLTTDEGVDHAIKALAWAAAYGLDIVNTAIGGHSGHDEDERAFLDNIESVAEAATAAGVTIGLEVHGPLMATGRESLALLDRIAHPAVRVNYDTGNVAFYGGEAAADDVGSIADRLVHVHLKDSRGRKGNWDFPAIGEGEVDFARVLESLEQAGYAGPFSIEIEFEGEPWPSIADVTAALNRSREHLASLGLNA